MTDGPYSAIADDDHLARLAVSDSEAFAELYRRYMTRVYHYLLARTQHVPDAEDLTARTFMTALENIHRYRPGGKFLAWLLTIARNKAVDHFRKHRRIHPLEDAEMLPNTTPAPEETVARNLQLEQVAQALDRLPPDRAEVLRLRLFGEMTAREISEQTGKTEAATKMLIHRAWRDLRGLLLPLLAQED